LYISAPCVVNQLSFLNPWLTDIPCEVAPRLLG
jgi:hypothetical protein